MTAPSATPPSPPASTPPSTPPALADRDRGPGTGHRVRLTGAVKRYGAVEALAGVDLDVAPGTFLVLLGPSGSGKSTLIRALAGVEHLDGGQIHIGADLVSGPRRQLPPERRDLAMVFQDYALWPHMTALGNVGFAVRRRDLPADQARSRALEALERVGLHGLADRYPHELSGGQQQRVALARAVVARPGLLLFDEPLSNLDADLRERLRVEISTLTREAGATAVYITHDQGEAFALADVVGVLDHGRLVQLGAPETVYNQPATPFVARFTGVSAELAATVAGVDGDHVLLGIGSRRLAALAVGGDARLLVRPFAAEIAGADTGSLEGTVVDIAYRGRGYDHVVDVAGTLLTGVHASAPHARGARIGIVLDPQGCIAYPASVEHEVTHDA